jgi:hypothetical protein
VAKHILQDDCAPLERRKPHEGAQTHRGDLVVLIGGIRSGNHVKGLVILHHRVARAAAQQIERCVVGDTKQPAFRVVEDTGIRHRGKGLNQRVLNNVLAIDGGAGHARAISMELWTKLTRQLFELIAHRISHWISCPQDGSLIRIIRRAQDVGIVAKAVGDAVHISWIAE